MNTIHSYFIVVTTLFLLISCGKMPINGKLDGRWQLMSIHYLQADSIYNPEFTYYDFSLHILQLKQTHGEENEIGGKLGRFNYTGDSLHIMMIKQTPEAVKDFGMNDTIQHFGINVLTKKRMELRSDYSKLIFRKF